jgi:hypothetical protein
MTQQGRDKNDQDQGSSADDLHHSFVDFVVRTALYHRAIDQPTGQGMGYKALADAIERALRDAPGYGAPLTHAVYSAGGNNLTNIQQGQMVRANVNGALADAINHVQAGGNANQAAYDAFIDRVVARVAAGAANADAGAAAALTPAVVAQLKGQYPGGNMTAAAASGLASKNIRNIPGLVVVGAGQNQHHFDAGLGVIATNADIDDAYKRLVLLLAAGEAHANNHITVSNANNWNGRTGNDFRDALNEYIATAVANHAAVVKVRNDLNRVVPDQANALQVNDIRDAVRDALNAEADRVALVIRTNVANGAVQGLDAHNNYRNVFQLGNVTTTGAQNAIAGKFAGQHNALNRVANDALLRDVFKAINNDMHTKVREFYKAFLNVIETNGVNWSFEELANPANNINLANLANYRVNLKKNLGDRTKIAFAETLPLVKKGAKAWFTSNAGVRSEDMGDADYLVKLYHKIYRSQDNHADYVGGNAADTFEATQSLVRNMIRNNTDSDQALRSHRRSSPPGTLPDTPLDFLFDNSPMVELATGKVWKRDADGLYREDNGKKIYAHKSVKELEQNGTKCYSIGGIKAADCGKLLKCLVDGDSRALGTCLEDIYQDVDMFKAAKDDVTATHPNMAVFVLKKFGFKADKKTSGGVTFKRCQSVDSWLAGKSVSADEKKAIDANEALKDYLKGLVHWINSEPAILNKHLTGDKPSAGDSRPEMFKNLELCQYTEPVERKGRMSFTAGLLANAAPIKAPVLGLHFGNRINPATNAVFGFPQYGRGDAMAGGCMTGGAQVSSAFVENLVNRRSNDGTVGCVDTYRALVDSTVNDLNSMGYKLDGNDMNKITDSLAQLQNLENKLRKLNGILSDFVTISDAWGMDYRAAGKGDRTVPLDQINTSADMERYLNATMNELKKSINNNMNLQAMGANNMQKTAANMITKVVGLEDDV